MGIISRVKSVFSKPSSSTSISTKSTYQDPGAGGKGAGTYYTPAPPGTGLYTPAPPGTGLYTPASGGSSSGGGGSSGTPVASTPTGTLLSTGQIVPQSIPPPTSTKTSGISVNVTGGGKTIQSQGFSGKVEQFSSKGVPEATYFLVGGKKTGQIDFESGQPKYAQTFAPSIFTFDSGKTKEEYTFTGQGLSLTTSTLSPSSSFLTDERTGRPFGTITAAPSGLLEQYKAFKPELPYVRRTLEFGKGKLGGTLFGKYSPFTYGEAKGIEPAITKYGEIPAFFIPVAGAGLLAGLSIETFGTSKGRTGVFETSQAIKESYGVPTGVTTTGQFVLAGLGTYIGGKALVGDVNRLLGFPKTETRLIGASQDIAEGRVQTNVLFETRTKTLFGTRRDLGYAVGKTDLIATSEEGLTTGRTLTTGVFGRTGFRPTSLLKETPTPEIFNLRQFQSVTGTISKGSDVLATRRIQDIVLSREFEGSKDIFFGRGSVGKNIFSESAQLGKGLTKFQFFGGGKSILQEEYTILAGKTFPLREGELLRQGRGMFGGIIKRNIQSYDDVIRVYRPSSITKTPLSQTFKLEYPQEVQKILQTGGQAVSTQSLFKQVPGFQRGLGLIQRGRQETRQRDSLNLGQALSYSQSQLFKQKDIFGTTPIFDTRGATKTRELFRTATSFITIPAQSQRFVTRQTFRNPTGQGLPPFTPTRLFPPRLPPVIPLNFLGLESFPGRGSSLLGSFTSRYSPSLTSSAFRLFGRPSSKALRTGIVTPFERRYLLGKSKRRMKGGKKKRR